MRKFQLLFSFLLVGAMISPFHTKAEGAEKIIIPRHSMLTYDVATLDVVYSSELSGSTISVYRIQDEGEFLYYTYQVGWEDVTELQFLLKEGDYRLTAEIPSSESTGKVVFELPFTIDDPDMDETQSFERTEMTVLLDCNDSIQEDELNLLTQETKDGIIQKGAVYVMARRKISVGDLELDKDINAGDASLILQCSAESGAGDVKSFTSLQVLEADVDKNGVCNAEDATIILQYATKKASGNYQNNFESYLKDLSSGGVTS